MEELILKRYKEVDELIKSLEGEKKEISGKIVSAFKELNMKKANTSFGTFSLVEKTIIKPSDEGQVKINDLEFEFKKEKDEIIKMDIERGTAKAEKSEYLRFQTIK